MDAKELFKNDYGISVEHSWCAYNGHDMIKFAESYKQQKSKEENEKIMDATYSQKQEILKKRGITPASKDHDYDYLYKSIITAMEEYHKVKSKEEAQERFKEAHKLLTGMKHPLMGISKSLRIAAGIEGKEEG
jgi:hypothetical protein